MKYLFGFAFCFLLSDGLAQSTCSPQISTQEDIDNFSSNYPSCEILLNSLTLSSSSITNLEGLSQITEVRGDLWLQHLSITSLEGLNSIKRIDDKLFLNSIDIENLEGLDNLESIGETFEFFGCDSLTSFSGALKLSSIEENLEIYGCRKLPNLSGLPANIEIGKGLLLSWCDSLTTLEGLEPKAGDIENLVLYSNNRLVSLSGIENLKIHHDIDIQNHDILSNLDGLTLADTISGDIYIGDNNMLTNIEGLSGPSYIDDLELKGNDSLKSLSGLETVRIIDDLNLISNDELVDLKGLDSLSLIGTLNIELEDKLSSLEGLENVDTIYRLRLYKNDQIQDLKKLSALKSIMKGITLTGNSKLLSVDGLENVTFCEYIGLTGNDALKNLDGFRNITTLAGPLYVQSHDSLVDISGLANIEPTTIDQEGTNISNYDITIRNNELLSDCSIASVCNKISQTGALVRIEGNATGCLDIDEVVLACESSPGLTGYIYEDKNDNGQYDEGDLPVANCMVAIALNSSTEASDYTDNEGYYRIFVEGGEYPLQYGTDGRCYDPMLVDTTIVIVDSLLTFQDYPYVRNATDELLPPEGFGIHLGRAATRCGFTVRHHVSVVNNTCLDSKGTLLYMIDDLVDSIFNISNPAAILSDQNITVSIDETLLPGQSFDFTFDAIMPGPEAINTFIKDSVILDYTFESNPNLNGNTTQTFSSEIRCAYDPNDKLAQPDRSDDYDKAYLLDEAIVYTIRFQNTGNDTAFVVRLEDEISPLLNISTLKPVQASHDYQLQLDAENRLLTVIFEDILLPDSTTNLIGSSGFFSFTIMPVEGLDDFTTIENNADIYFDFNPPIRTNTFELTYVHDLSILIATEDIQQSEIRIYPNPVFDKINIPDLKYASYEIWNVQGQLVQLGLAKTEIDVSKLSASLYMIVFKDELGGLIGRTRMLKN